MKQRFIDIHTHKSNSDPEVLSLHSFAFGRDDALPAAPFSAGIHPWDAERVDRPTALRFLQDIPADAIGEIGLDYVRAVDRTLQRQILEAQLLVAQQRNLPVIIHCVKAYQDMLPLLKGRPLRGVILHGYIGSPQQMQALIEAGFYISFGYTAFRSPKTMESLRLMPSDRLFLETDTALLSIKEVYNMVSQALKLELESLQTIIFNNYKRIFV